MSRYVKHRQLLVASFGAGVTTVGIYSYTRKHHFTHHGSGTPAWWRKAHPEAFEISTPGNDKQWRSSMHLLLSKERCERVLRSGEKRIEICREGSPIIRWESNLLDSNAPCEDLFAIDLVSKTVLRELREEKKTDFWGIWGERAKRWNKEDDVLGSLQEKSGGVGDDDLLFVSVMDGHAWGGGWEISTLLKKTLHGCLAYGLSGLKNIGTEEAGRPADVAQMLRDVFVALDQDIQRGVLSLLDPAPHSKNAILPNPPPSHIAMTNLESPGSCAITAIVDVADKKLYVDNLVDGRAVAGWYDPYEKMWRCDVLSSDHMVDDPDEEKRSVSEHPESEKDDVICAVRFGERTLGCDEITRAFGNTFYKRPAEDSKRLGEAFDIPYPELKKEVKTPPCISNIPDVIVRDLEPENGEQLGIVILASDGLWDNLTSKEAALLFAAHMTQNLSQAVPKSRITSIVPFIHGIKLSRPFPAKFVPGTLGYTAAGYWCFGDGNAATYLVRNALGRGDPLLRRLIMSMKDGIRRSFRYDTTVVVVTFATNVSDVSRQVPEQRHREENRVDCEAHVHCC